MAIISNHTRPPDSPAAVRSNKFELTALPVRASCTRASCPFKDPHGGSGVNDHAQF